MGSIPSSRENRVFLSKDQTRLTHTGMGARGNATLNNPPVGCAHGHADPLYFLKLKYFFIKVFWGGILFLQAWVCLLSFFPLWNDFTCFPFSFLNFNGPESMILPEFEHSEKKTVQDLPLLKASGEYILQALLPHPRGFTQGGCVVPAKASRCTHKLPAMSFTSSGLWVDSILIL